MPPVDWKEVFVPNTSLLELLIRGTLMYWALFALLRVLGRRNIGELALSDLLLVVLIADAAQHAMSAQYRSVPEGIVLCATIAGWSYFLDWLAIRSDAVQRLLEPPPLVLIRDGKLQKRVMRRELITEDEVMSHMRLEGISDIRSVRRAYIEPDGQISFL
ncbi:MAG TPA: YetF domain-containing protein, partial [Candidatus Krumholzibacteria bacterium]|nr:YetF domain-containing protein [Candidatus Krumholzibacteria bacterium]